MLLSRRRFAALLALVMLIAGCGGGDDTDPASPGGAPASTSEAVAFQMDAGHSGVANEPTPAFPLPPAWQRTFAGAVSYPLIAAGKVFVVVGDASFNGRPQLVAIDQITGLDAWPAVPIGTGFTAAHAYDQGRIFVIGSDSILRSFDAATGAGQWSTLLSFYQGAPPVARGGRVYVTNGNAVYAVDGHSGAILWTASTMGQTSPSLSTTGVLLTSACQVFSLLQSTGAEQWRISSPSPCNGGAPGQWRTPLDVPTCATSIS